MSAVLNDEFHSTSLKLRGREWDFWLDEVGVVAVSLECSRLPYQQFSIIHTASAIIVITCPQSLENGQPLSAHLIET